MRDSRRWGGLNPIQPINSPASEVRIDPLRSFTRNICRASMQRNPTATSARFRVGQLHDFEDRSADLHGGRLRAHTGSRAFELASPIAVIGMTLKLTTGTRRNRKQRRRLREIWTITCESEGRSFTIIIGRFLWT